MQNKLLTIFENKQIKQSDFPSFRPGDTVRVTYRILEAAKAVEKGKAKAKDADVAKFRLQPFEGVVIRRNRGTMGATFTVRKIGANGIGVERVFPYQSSNINKIEVVARGIVKQSRLYYLRELSGKSARIKSRFDSHRKALAADAPAAK